jgi:small subunit ribosomal protein S17
MGMEENREDMPVEGAAEGAASDGGPDTVDEGLTAEAATAGEEGEAESSAAEAAPRHRHQEKVGLVTSDKMEKTVVVRVERQVRHPKYKRYIRRRTKFMAHNEMGAGLGDIVRIVETRPLSARKRWRVVEILQKAR